MIKRKITQKDKINNEKEMVKFLNNYGVAKRLKFLSMSLTNRRVKNLKFEFELGGASCTNGKFIRIGVPEYLIGHTKASILASLKALTGHESQHIISTPFDLYKEFQEKFAKYFLDTYNINEGISMQVANYLVNAIEDGRIERILVTDTAPGLEKGLVFFRSLWWKAQPVEGKDELMDTLFAFCTFATMGLYPLEYCDHYGEELQDMVRGVKHNIFKAVDSDDFIDATNHIWRLVYKIEPWLVEKMKKISDANDFAQQMQDQMQQQFGEHGQGTPSGAQGNGNSQKGNGNSNSSSGKKKMISSAPIGSDEEEQNKNGSNGQQGADGSEQGKDGKGGNSKDEKEGDDSSNPIHNAFNDGEISNDKSDERGDIQQFGDREDNGTETDIPMKKVVENALRNAEEETIEDEYDNVIQADFDDLKEQKRIETENAMDNGTTLSNQEIGKLQKTYSDQDYSWDVPFHSARRRGSLYPAPDQIKLEAKVVQKELKTILMDKVVKHTKNRRRGMLDTNALHKTATGSVDIFQKKGIPNDTDYVFYLLVDGSGSMSGNKFTEAFRATSVIEEAIGGFIPLKIAQFNYATQSVKDRHVTCVFHEIVKDFEEYKTGKNFSWTHVNNSYPRGCNMDGYSIRVATAELKKRPEKKKVLIIHSDGLPNGAGSYGGSKALKDVHQAIREARKEGIHVFNIMFGSERERRENGEDFKFMYEKGIVNCDPSMISQTLLKIVKRELKN